MAITMNDVLSGVQKPVNPVSAMMPPPIDKSLQGAGTTTPPPITTQAPVQAQTPVQTQPRTDAERVIKSETAPAPKRLSYTEMFQQLSPYKPPTPEELEKERKKQKRESIFAAISDGISAISNLYFTTQYAPNAYDPSRGMAATTKARFDRLKKEREDNQRQYMDGFMRAMRMDAEDARDERNWNHTLERERISDARYEAKAARDAEMAQLDRRLRQNQITAAEYKAEQERIAAKYAEDTERLKQENLRAGVKQKQAAAGASAASATASYSRAEYYKNGGGSKGPTLQLEDDEPRRFGNDKDYDRAVMRLAPDYGVATTEVQVIERDHMGNPKKQRTIQRPVKDIAADIEREAARRKKSGKDDFSQYEIGSDEFSQYEKK